MSSGKAIILAKSFCRTPDNVIVSQSDTDCPCCPLLSLSSQGINWIRGRAALEKERKLLLWWFFWKWILLSSLKTGINLVQSYCSNLIQRRICFHKHYNSGQIWLKQLQQKIGFLCFFHIFSAPNDWWKRTKGGQEMDEEGFVADYWRSPSPPSSNPFSILSITASWLSMFRRGKLPWRRKKDSSLLSW